VCLYVHLTQYLCNAFMYIYVHVCVRERENVCLYVHLK